MCLNFYTQIVQWKWPIHDRIVNFLLCENFLKNKMYKFRDPKPCIYNNDNFLKILFVFSFLFTLIPIVFYLHISYIKFVFNIYNVEIYSLQTFKQCIK